MKRLEGGQRCGGVLDACGIHIDHVTFRKGRSAWVLGAERPGLEL